MVKELKNREELAGLLDRYDTILFDCDGVVWEGDHVIEGADSALKHIRSLGKRVFFVTNNATKSRSENKRKFDKLGIECRVDEIFSSAYASAAYLRDVLELPKDKYVYVVGEKGIEDELDAVGVKHKGGTVSRISFPVCLAVC